MGGPGSGRRRTKLSVEDCRLLDIGELCDGGAAKAFSHGQIIWRSELWPGEVALLAYALVRKQRPHHPSRLLLCYVYWPAADARPKDDEVELAVRRGVRMSALCPACGRAARRLYAPPAAIDFSCRVCQGLVYPPSAPAAARRARRALLAPLAAEIGAACDGSLPPPDEAELSNLGSQGRRLACLRLQAAGLSIRQIAARLGSSKSSVHRILAAGPESIDPVRLYNERDERSFASQSLSQQLRSLRRLAAVERDLYRRPARPSEVRLLCREEGEIETLGSTDDYARCVDRLCRQGERRLSLEFAARPRRRR